MENREQRITLSEDNLNTPETRKILRYILDRGEVQVNFNVRMRRLEHRINQLKLRDTNMLEKMIKNLKDLLVRMAQKDMLISEAGNLQIYLEQFDKLVEQLEKNASLGEEHTQFKPPLEIIYYSYKDFMDTVTAKHKELEKYPTIYLSPPNFAEIKPGERLHLVLNNEEIIVDINQLTLLSRQRGKGKVGAVLEVIKDDTKLGEGSFAEVKAVHYKVVKQGKHSTQVLTHGIDTGNQYVDKVSSNMTTFNIEDEFLTDLPHVHAKNAHERHAIMRNLPNLELFDALYSNTKKLSLPSERAGDFFIEFAKDLMTAYARQIQKQKIVHRDIKPQNIRVEVLDQKTAKLGEINFIDFNLSQRFGKPAKWGGTPDYLVPELVKNPDGPLISTTAADVYVLGIVIIETFAALTGYSKDFDDYLRKTGTHMITEIEESLTKKEKKYDKESTDELFKARRQILIEFLQKALNETDLHLDHKEQLKKLIEAMLSVDPKDRPEVGSILETLSKLELGRNFYQSTASYYKPELAKVTSKLETELQSVNLQLNQAKLKRQEAENSGNSSDLFKLGNTIKKLEDKKTELQNTIQKTKDSFLLDKTTDPSHSANLDGARLKILGDKILPDLRHQLSEPSSNVFKYLEKIKGLFSDVASQKVVTNQNIHYFLRNLGIKSFQQASSIKDMQEILNQLEINLKNNVKSLTLHLSMIVSMQESAKKYPNFDASVLDQLHRELNDLLKQVESITDIDSMTKAIEKMERRKVRTSATLAEVATELDSLELQKFKNDSLMALKSHLSRIEFMQEAAKKYPDSDPSNLKRLHQKLEDLLKQVEGIKDVDSMKNASKEMKSIKIQISEVATELDSLELQKVQADFLRVLSTDELNKKSGLFDRTFNKDKTKQTADLLNIINTAKDVSSLVKNVKSYIDKIPLISAKVVKESMESAISSLQQDQKQQHRKSF